MHAYAQADGKTKGWRAAKLPNPSSFPTLLEVDRRSDPVIPPKDAREVTDHTAEGRCRERRLRVEQIVHDDAESHSLADRPAGDIVDVPAEAGVDEDYV